jgi:hypothetical protein
MRIPKVSHRWMHPILSEPEMDADHLLSIDLNGLKGSHLMFKNGSAIGDGLTYSNIVI